MGKPVVSRVPMQEFPLWEKMRKKRRVFSFDLEVTARCNNNCRHCNINLLAGDREAKEKELSFEEIKKISEDAVSLGALWCLLTGGEPLLRDDFFDIYLSLKKMGLLVSVFTNAALIKDEHIRVFKEYPPKSIEVTVYGVIDKTYERVTQKPGSFACFKRGLNLLLENNIKVRLKAMAIRSNVHELKKIARFCRSRTKDFFRFDPFLHLRFDGNQTRNQEIKSERLTPSEIVAIEYSDSERFQALKKSCDMLIVPGYSEKSCSHLFFCGAGVEDFSVSYDGKFRLCSSLWHPECIYDLRKDSLFYAWNHFVRKVRSMVSERKEYQDKCLVCPVVNLCMWCPAHAHLETGELDLPVDYFCKMAHARAKALKDLDM